MVKSVILKVCKNGQVEPINREAAQWMAGAESTSCHRLVAARDVDGRPICSSSCAERFRDGRHAGHARTRVVIRGQLCQLECQRREGQALVVIDSTGKRAPSPPYLLTAREKQMLTLLAGGLSAEGVAARLHLSACTVRTHLDHVRRRLLAAQSHPADSSTAEQNVRDFLVRLDN